jgi:hypothetical protein
VKGTGSSPSSGPRNICWTHPDEVNTALLAFLTR